MRAAAPNVPAARPVKSFLLNPNLSNKFKFFDWVFFIKASLAFLEINSAGDKFLSAAASTIFCSSVSLTPSAILPPLVENLSWNILPIPPVSWIGLLK